MSVFFAAGRFEDKSKLLACFIAGSLKFLDGQCEADQVEDRQEKSQRLQQQKGKLAV